MIERPREYGAQVPGDEEFSKFRAEWRARMSCDENLRSKAIDLIRDADRYRYGYQWEWCGVPIIKHPDDIVLQQEIMWATKPAHVVETGVARGGSLVLSSTLMEMAGTPSSVLGIDIAIFEHSKKSLGPWVESERIILVECDSSSEMAIQEIKNFLGDDSQPSLLVLDSNHSHNHVLAELRALAPLFPVRSVVIVADTIIDEHEEDYYPNRPWEKGNSPLSAVKAFLNENDDFILDQAWSRRSLMGECRDGILRKVK